MNYMNYIHSNYIRDINDYRDISLSLHSVNELWIYYYSVFNIRNDDHLLCIVHKFFDEIENIEAFFYYMMSKRFLVDKMKDITMTYIGKLRAAKIISHIIDGWEDFFLRTDYTLFNYDEENELESYRIKIYQVLHFIIPFIGEDFLHAYYKIRLCDYFLIRVERPMSIDNIQEGEEENNETDDD